MASSPPTIIDLKSSFLRTQITLLSQPLVPSPSTLSTISESENALRQRSIDDALRKANQLLRKHNRVVYGPQATRHVAEQIDRLYWGPVEGNGVLVGEEWAERGADLRKEELIQMMPEEWSEEAETAAPEKAGRYKELQVKLVEAKERRREAKERLRQWRAAKTLLAPLDGEEAGVQANLVVRDGEAERELERMRMLMLRVERGLSALDDLGDRGVDEMDMDVEGDAEERLRRVLGGI
ncbi:kinetochore Sim4 complex subunit Fta4 [Bisporella sp. PMI_857]|nr:kinetochore Sim4 complex subunit Fta4 [Bisporella sp. PMI_857]